MRIKKTVTRRLDLHRETLARLESLELGRVAGGAPTRPVTCAPTCDGPTCLGCPLPP